MKHSCVQYIAVGITLLILFLSVFGFLVMNSTDGCAFLSGHPSDCPPSAFDMAMHHMSAYAGLFSAHTQTPLSIFAVFLFVCTFVSVFRIAQFLDGFVHRKFSFAVDPPWRRMMHAWLSLFELSPAHA